MELRNALTVYCTRLIFYQQESNQLFGHYKKHEHLYVAKNRTTS